MKKKILLTMTVCFLAALTACGSKETENVRDAMATISEQEVAAKPTTENPIVEKENEDVLSSIVDEDEVIGDFDYFMSMDDMEVKTIGVDISVSEGKVSLEDALITLNLESIQVLFPKEAFCIDKNTAECPGIIMSLDVMTCAGGGSVARKDNEAVVNYGNYCLYTKQGRNSDIGFAKTYEIYLPDEDYLIMMILGISKTDNEYQELADAFVEAYVPAFEEVLISNLQ